MRILVMGGTQFVGRHFVQAALDAGHDVTLFHRGRSGPGLFPKATHLLGDRDGDLSVLADGTWDATVDVCAYVPRQVRALAAALGSAAHPDGHRDGRGGHYTQISSISAYADPPGPGVTEDSPLAELDDPDVEEVTPETYGGLKALCERAAVDVFGPGTAIVRPCYVIGPFDTTGRYTWWVRRLARGGEVLVAGPRDQPLQTVDGRDLAALTLRVVESGASGAVNAASQVPGYCLEDLLTETASAVAPVGTSLTWVDPEFAREGGLTGAQLPLWHGGERAWVGAVDVTRAASLGLSPRPVAATALDIVGADPATGVPTRIGLDPDRETELLAAWRGR